MRKKVVVFVFSLFSMTLFCAEGSLAEKTGWSQYKERRDRLMKEIKSQYPGVRDGVVVLFANFEVDAREFQQEPNFYYLTGVKEPGTILLLDFSGESVLYIPDSLEKRFKWTSVQRELLEKDVEQLGFSEIVELESTATGPFLVKSHYSDLCKRLSEVTQKGGTTFHLLPLINTPTYSEQQIALIQLIKFVPNLYKCIENISSILFSMRQVKDEQEIECLRKAIAITIKAQKTAARTIKAGKTEREIRAAVDGTILTESRPGFCSIIGSEKNTTCLHHLASSRVMNNGELVIVDIGAECPWNSYTADMTRVFPVSGKFAKKQRAIYNIVFEASQSVAENAKPGYWFRNNKNEKKSLYHIAKNVFKKYGYGQYFTHGIGHHIGLSVHEDCVENLDTFFKPLRVGNVIALEPGLYFPKKGIGVRIESNYLITKDKAVCLDEALPKDPDGIERLMQAHTEKVNVGLRSRACFVINIGWEWCDNLCRIFC